MQDSDASSSSSSCSSDKFIIDIKNYQLINPFSKSKFNLSEAHALESVRNPESTMVEESSLDKQLLEEMISPEASAAISDIDSDSDLNYSLESQIAEAQLNWDSLLQNEALEMRQNEIASNQLDREG